MDGGLALRLPAYSGAAAPPRAALQLASSGPRDPLDVGVQDFEFGADFRLDAESQGTEVDGGNNLIQRGLASDPGQFKIDVDGGRVGCRVAGSEGVVEARISSSVRPDTWYRARCSRNGDVVDVRIVAATGAGLVRDTHGSYTFAWIGAGVLCLVATVLSLMVPRLRQTISAPA